VAHQRGLARAEVAMQFDERIAHGRTCREAARKGRCVVLAPPGHGDAGRGDASYNGRVTFNSAQIDPHQLVARVRQWAGELGFSQIGVAGVDLSSAEPGLMQWLAAGFHGSMDYMAAHGLKRARPAELVPGTVSVITARMDYLPRASGEGWQAIELSRLRRAGEGDPSRSMPAVGTTTRWCARVCRSCRTAWPSPSARFGHRVFADSAPVLEAELAARSGQGWRGKHTLILSREAGSLFFLGEIYVDLALPASAPAVAHCGAARPASIFAPRRRSSRPTGLMRGDASPT
jgi:epoxyqueuosine reductase